MPPGCTVIFGEGVPRPQDHHFRSLLQHINGTAAVEIAPEGGVGRHGPCFVLAGIVLREDLISRLYAGDCNLFVIHHAGYLGSSLRDGSRQHPQKKNYACRHEKQ